MRPTSVHPRCRGRQPSGWPLGRPCWWLLALTLPGALASSACASLSAVTVPSPHLVGITLLSIQRGAPQVAALSCPVDPVLREILSRPPLPSSPTTQGDLAAFSIAQEATISVAEARKDLAVRSLDNCNEANKKLAEALAQPQHRAWWHVW